MMEIERERVVTFTFLSYLLSLAIIAFLSARSTGVRDRSAFSVGTAAQRQSSRSTDCASCLEFSYEARGQCWKRIRKKEGKGSCAERFIGENENAVGGKVL
jgi:hypothetical protein